MINYHNVFFKSFLTYSRFRDVFVSNWMKKYFDSEEDKMIFHVLKKNWVEKHKLLTKDDLYLCFTNNNKVKDKNAILEKIEDIFNIDMVNYTESFVYDYFLDKLKYNRVRFAITKIVHQFKDGKIDVDYTRDNILKSLELSIDKDDLGMDYFNTSVIDRMLLMKEQQKTQFGTGINKELDDMLKLKRKSIVALSAQLGIGKSLMLKNLAANCVKQGFNVLFLPLEMDTIDVSERFDKIILDFESDKYYENIDVVQKRMDDYKNNNIGKLFIKEYPPYSFSSYQLKSLLDRYRSKNINIDVVIVDYLTIMRPNSYSRDDSTYNKGKTIATELKSVAMEEECLIFTVLQVNRQAYNKSDQGPEALAESMAIGHLLDSLINAFEYIDESTEQKYIIISTSKIRRGKRKKKKIYLKMLDNLRFVDVDENESRMLDAVLCKKSMNKGFNKSYSSNRDTNGIFDSDLEL